LQRALALLTTNNSTSSCIIAWHAVNTSNKAGGSTIGKQKHCAIRQLKMKASVWTQKLARID
jgi:hypothetical protein